MEQKEQQTEEVTNSEEMDKVWEALFVTVLEIGVGLIQLLNEAVVPPPEDDTDGKNRDTVC